MDKRTRILQVAELYRKEKVLRIPYKVSLNVLAMDSDLVMYLNEVEPEEFTPQELESLHALEMAFLDHTDSKAQDDLDSTHSHPDYD